MPEPAKLTFEQLIAGMQVFLHFPQVEAEVENSKAARIESAAAFVNQANDAEPGTADDIVALLTVDRTGDYKERLKLLIATSAGSLEVLDRVCMVICPEQPTWSRRRLSASATQAIAEFLINPNTVPTVPRYVRERLRLPVDFLNRAQSNIAREVHSSLQSLYNTRSGFAVEDVINRTVQQTGYTCEKGQVALVDNKEVDAVLPGLTLPRILIMASYQLTTASSQSQRAREQQTMYEHVGAYNNLRDNRNAPDVQLVNVVDGGGWLARPKDLAEMHRYCDYALAVSHLDDLLPLILRHHMEQ